MLVCPTTKLTWPARAGTHESPKTYMLAGSGAAPGSAGPPLRDAYADPRRSGLFSYCIGMDTTGSYSGASARRRPTTRT
jgi:hypothetical protein